ncbi:HipA domain-containing protein [Phytoactinopolyspora limicola]|uniref:HipA domain-containing protein n=1 Tax=Phytoactinopolyspora limicola TaxID=2715536 RepID=UPI001408382D|nr:HipA domain-containing protein [Phytoactinopolyspora limicola]
MARQELSVWLDGREIATLREPLSGKIALEYSDVAAGQWLSGRPVISVALPMRPDRRHSPSVVTPYFEGLLPEGPARSILEEEFGIRRGDTFSLLAAIGRDCAGAVVIQPRSETAPSVRHAVVGQRLTDQELRGALDGLGAHPLGASREVRVSLAGQQDKLLLSRDHNDGWLRPTGQSPSTHILKPENAHFPGSVRNEALCLNLARAMSLSSIDVEVIELGGPVLVVSRYDRVNHNDETVSRLHQEDSCQALSVPVDFLGEAKYQIAGGPSFKDVAGLLDSFADDQLTELQKLLETMVFTVAIGNADAHGKNLSLLHDPIGSVRLAPLYDVMCTAWYPDVATPRGTMPVSTELAMTIGPATDVHGATVDDLVAEAISWRFNEQRARRIVDATLERMAGALDSAAEETTGVDEGIVALIRGRIRNLTSRHPAGRR